jgi:hypothetical protein
MKTCKIYLIIFLIISSKLAFSQQIDPFLDYYSFKKMVKSGTANDYQGIDGSPYLNKDFVEGTCDLKDSAAIKLQLRYNMYSDEMEYRLKDVTYSIKNTEKINRVIMGESVFLYLPFIQKGGYFEIYEPGKCLLAQKRSVKFYPAEAAKPIEGISKPARFVNESDVFYIIFSESKVFKITNTKSVLEALQNQKPKIESYMDQEKIKNTKKESLIKIIKYYNSL